MKPVYFILMIVALSCTKARQQEDPSVGERRTTESVSGVWVEIENSTDTLDFDRLAPTSFVLGRGLETRNGFKKPKSGIGSYRYKIQNNKISLVWGFSSSTHAKDYYFRLLKDTLTIENFYDTEQRGVRQVFVQVK
jgi:hypothetical protein